MTDMTETSGEENAVETGTTHDNEHQELERTFTQADVDKIVQARLDKYKKRYADVDMNEYKSLKQQEEERELEAMNCAPALTAIVHRIAGELAARTAISSAAPPSSSQSSSSASSFSSNIDSRRWT